MVTKYVQENEKKTLKKKDAKEKKTRKKKRRERKKDVKEKKMRKKRREGNDFTKSDQMPRQGSSGCHK